MLIDSSQGLLGYAATLHSITTQKMLSGMLTTMKTSNLAVYESVFNVIIVMLKACKFFLNYVSTDCCREVRSHPFKT
jgi:hypothetical protein